MGPNQFAGLNLYQLQQMGFYNLYPPMYKLNAEQINQYNNFQMKQME